MNHLIYMNECNEFTIRFATCLICSLRIQIWKSIIAVVYLPVGQLKFSMVRGFAILWGNFYDRVRIYGYKCQQFFYIFQAFCKNSFIVELFRHFPIYGYDFQKIFRIYGTIPYLGNFSDPTGWISMKCDMCTHLFFLLPRVQS